MGSPAPSNQPRVSVAGDTFAPRLPKKALGGAVGAVVVLISAMPARALVTVTVSEIGGDVVMSGSGSLNVSALTYIGGTAIPYGIDPNTSTFLVNSGPQTALYQGQFTLPASLGPGTASLPSLLPSTGTYGTGDSFGIAFYADVAGRTYQQVPTLFVEGGSGYTNGTAISGTSTYTGQTLSSLGLTPGNYTWSWGSGATADSITMQIGNSVAPGPASVPGPLPILGLAAAFGFSRKLRKRIKLHKGTSAVSTSPAA